MYKSLKIKIFYLFIFCCAVTAFAKPVTDASRQITVIPQYNIKNYDNMINKIYQDPNSHSLQLNIRLLNDSQYFLGKPYILGSLGEGPDAQFDKNPLYRHDGFDCETFVDTVLALVESNNLQQFQNNINKIRYFDGMPTYISRNHFTDVDWNLANQRNDYIVDVTKQIFPHEYKLAKAYIDRPNWFRNLSANNIKLFKEISSDESQQLLDKLHAQGDKVKGIASELPYVPLSVLFNANGEPNKEMFAKIPDDSIIEVVRPNWDLAKQIGTNLNISHLGFAIRINGVLMYREASSLDNKVIDIPLEKYLSEYLQSPTIKGIHIEKIQLAKNS